MLAPETGEYEFVVRTEHAARLWVNDPDRPLIDAWVKSGNDTEFRGTHLPARRPGVPAAAGVLQGQAGRGRLEEEPRSRRRRSPRRSRCCGSCRTGAAEVDPGAAPVAGAARRRRSSSPTPFPPDDRSLGWERGTTVSKEWDQATTDAALETAGYVAGRSCDELAGDPRRAPPDRDREAPRRSAATFAERAFRRPLTDDQKRLYVDRQFAAATDPEVAVKRVVLLVLKSPRFLYREVGGGPDAYDVASRLSFGLWDSLPDEELLDAAAAGKLAHPRAGGEAGRADAGRPAGEGQAPRVPAHLAEGRPRPGPGEGRRSGSPASTRPSPPTCGRRSNCSSTTCVWAETSDFRKLLLADELYLNGRLAKFYGADLPADAPFQKVKLDAGKRAGVLTHPYLLAAFAYTGDELADPPRRVPGPRRARACRCGRRRRRSPRWPRTCTRS